MPGVVVGGKQEQISGLDVKSWHDVPALRIKIGEDGRKRKTDWVRGICLHTTKGIPGGKDRRPQVIKPGVGPNYDAEKRVASYWAKDGRQAGAHFVIDFDGSIACLADLLTETTFHAGPVNEVSIGIEIYQGRDAEMYEGQLQATVRLVDYLTERFGIQRQFQSKYHGRPIKRLSSGGQDVVGVYGHRDVSNNRGLGDPGDAIFEFLKRAGYMPFDFDKQEDIVYWKDIQALLNRNGASLVEDGIPRPGTVAALKKAGHAHGLWKDRGSAFFDKDDLKR
jgi:hypothetical protein